MCVGLEEYLSRRDESGNIPKIFQKIPVRTIARIQIKSYILSAKYIFKIAKSLRFSRNANFFSLKLIFFCLKSLRL